MRVPFGLTQTESSFFASDLLLQAPLQSGAIAPGELSLADALLPDLHLGALAAPQTTITASGFPAVVDVSALDGTTGFTLSGITGPGIFENSGHSVSLAGDVNGDGFADIVVGAPFAGPAVNEFFGASYVVFGHAGGFDTDIDLSTLDGTIGFTIGGETASDKSGKSVSSGGDVNGDGFADILVGAEYAAGPNGANSGTTYVVFGHGGSFDSNLDLSAIDGSNGFKIRGAAASDHSGTSVSSAGDVNGDGFDDIIIGAPDADPHGSSSGASYVIFGHAGGFDANVDLSTLDGTNGFKISGETAYDDSGFSASSAGDVNGDGFADIVIGAPFANHGRAYGISYVVFGHAGGFDANVDLSALDGTNGFKIVGSVAEQTGRSVSSAGDVNGDGFADILIGAPANATNGNHSGAAYVVFGHAGSFDSEIALTALDGTNGFEISGISEYANAGYSVSSAGDVNGDGFDDIIVGAFGAGSNSVYPGAAYVVFGHAGGFSDNISLSALDGTNGFKIAGIYNSDYTGFSVSAAGDINGDGFADVIVGAPRVNGSAGASYIVFGQAPTEAVTRIGSVASQSISGGAFDDTLSGWAGNDILNGNDGNDIIGGGKGNDTLNGGNGNDILDPKKGRDHVSGDAGNDTIRMHQFLTTADNIDGGTGIDKLVLDGDYSAGVSLAHVVHVEALLLTGGNSYSIASADSTVASGATLTVKAGGLGAADSLHFDGSAETDGHFVLNGGAGDDDLIGGALSDTIHGGLGSNVLTGNGGADTFVLAKGSTDTIVYNAVSDSTGTGYDTVHGFDALQDHFDFNVSVGAVDATVTSGSLSTASFDTDLAAIIDANHLSAGDAVVFEATAGTLSGHTFLIVDANGTAGYQAGADFVIDITGAHHLHHLAAANFV